MTAQRDTLPSGPGGYSSLQPSCCVTEVELRHKAERSKVVTFV